MTALEPETIELAAADLTAEDARDLTDRIKITVEGAWHLIKQAYEQRAWVALGYLSWDDYSTREFGTSRLKLPKEDRSEVIGSLREAGLSIPAIASATGLGVGTVHRTLAEAEAESSDDSGFPNGKPELTPVDVNVEGEIVDTETGEVIESSPDRITGTDGKSYLAKDRAAIRARRKRIRELHESGHAPAQIADVMGMSYETVLINIKAMGLKPVRSREKGGRRLACGDAIDKFVTSISGLPIAVRTLRPADALDDDRKPVWLSDIDEAMKSLRSLRADLSKGDS